MKNSTGWTFLWIAIGLGAIGGCGVSTALPPLSEAGIRVLTESDHGETVELRVGDGFQVVLKGNPTTGYGWEIQEMDATTIRQAEKPVHVADSGMIGAGGKTTFRFQAMKTGDSGLVLVYRRPFESRPKPEKQFQVRLVIR